MSTTDDERGQIHHVMAGDAPRMLPLPEFPQMQFSAGRPPAAARLTIEDLDRIAQRAYGDGFRKADEDAARERDRLESEVQEARGVVHTIGVQLGEAREDALQVRATLVQRGTEAAIAKGRAAAFEGLLRAAGEAKPGEGAGAGTVGSQGQDWARGEQHAREILHAMAFDLIEAVIHALPMHGTLNVQGREARDRAFALRGALDVAAEQVVASSGGEPDAG